MRLPSQQLGFSLIELLIALGLGLVLSTGVVLVFVQNNRSAVQDEELARVLENGRYVMRTISRELAMSGYWGKFLDVSTTTLDPSIAIGLDCGDGVNPWALDLENLRFLNDASQATVAATYSCLPSADVVPGSDIIAMKRVADSAVLDAALVTNQVYMRTNSVAATMFLGGAAGTPPAIAGTAVNWPYLPSIYYLRSYSFSPGDGIPSLCRASLDNSAPPNMTSECLVEGVENLQLEFGIDDDDDAIADYFVSVPTAAEARESVVVRIHVMVRSLNEIPNYTNDKTFNVGPVNIAAANDGFFRRIFSTTILLRNSESLSGVGI